MTTEPTLRTIPHCPRGPVRAALGVLDSYLAEGCQWVPYAAIRAGIRLDQGTTFRSAVLASEHWKAGIAARGLVRQKRAFRQSGVGLAETGDA